MAWSISHTEEAWEIAELRLSLKKWLPTIRKALIDDDLEAWEEADDGSDIRSADEVIRDSRASYRGLSQEELVGIMLDRIREHMTCTNGGHEFYLDRQGYHTVPLEDFSPAERRALGL